MRFTSIIHEKIEVPSKAETLGVPRREMPQIDKKHMSKFIQDLAARGIKVKDETVHPDTLSATQGQFDKGKIAGITADIEKNGTDGHHPIIVSKDDRVMDGHHRWLAHANADKHIKICRVNKPAEDLLQIMHDHPKSYTEKLYEMLMLMSEGTDSCSIITPQVMKAFEAHVDKLFAPFKMDFDFTKHFRERMSDTRNNPCIDLKELAEMVKKIYALMKAGGKSLTKHVDAEVVIKDMQSDLNMPIALDYNRSKDEIDVVAKTIMRKKNFRSSSPSIVLK